MNQTLKDRFYSIGTKRHIKYVAAAGGMTEEEAAVLQLLHEKRDDQYIMDALAIDKNRLQAYYNGVPIAASFKALPAAVGSVEISLDNLLHLVVPTGCCCDNVTLPIDIYAWTTNAGVASVASVTVNLLKEA